MRFKRWPRVEGYNETSRKRAAFVCSQRQKCKKLPLFAELIRETQHDVDTEMVRRHERWRRAQLQLGAQNLEHIAAAQGYRIALLTPALFKDELESGRLIQHSGIVAQNSRGYWFMYPQTRGRTAKVKLFCDWILAQALL